MTAPVSTGLVRVTVATPQRRLDIALPDTTPVAELLPHLLRHAGEAAADDGVRQGGWTLRRGTGETVEPTRNLTAQGIRDGEVLHLVHRRTDWPEPAYDDVVEIIASGARRTGRSWGNVATRRCGLAAGAILLAGGVVGVLTAGAPWLLPGSLSLGFALVLTLVGTVLSRAGGDAVAGGVIAACALPYAVCGGLVVAAPKHVELTGLGAPHVLLAAAALMLFAAIGNVGAAALGRIFVAAVAAGLFGGLGALLCLASAAPEGAAAVVLTVALGLLPGYPLLSVWLGRLPVPPLPQRAEEMLEDRPAPPRSEVFESVHRAHEVLTGTLMAAAVSAGVCFFVLLNAGGKAKVALVVTGAVALLLRARLFPTPAQRIPMLVVGAAGLALPLLGGALTLSGTGRLVAVLVGVGVCAALVLSAGLTYSRRPLSPYVGRFGDILDVVAIMALLPLAFGVLGLYSSIQGMFASVG